MNRVEGILWAALSSSTFGLAPLFTLLLIGAGYSSFEVLTYRWGVASLCLAAYGVATGCSFRLGGRQLGTVFLLSLFRAATSLSLVIAYQNIASGMASMIHFMYPLVVALAMMCFFRERGSVWTFAAVGLSIVGACCCRRETPDSRAETRRWASCRRWCRSWPTAATSWACARAAPWRSTPRC